MSENPFGKRQTALGWLARPEQDAAARLEHAHTHSQARAVVVHPFFKSDLSSKQSTSATSEKSRTPQARLQEAISLAQAIQLEVSNSLVLTVRTRKPATLFGAGQVQQLAQSIADHKAGLLVVDGALSPLQQRNLEKAVGAKVIDRTGLILEIFGARARTREGVLQVELAHLTYQQSRLVRSWTHLERQRGGFGFLGGPGETQIETDRRLIRERIAKLQKALEDVTRTRGLHRKRRQKAPYPVVALVGYTNAGKSTLFNRLSGAEVLVQDQVFATLDPTMRGLDLPGVGRVIVSDTVGFISDLPTQLVAAFRATLEEVLQADILLHVQDCAHPDAQAQKQDVLHVLTELGLDFSDAGRAAVNEDKPILLNVLNKSDALEENEREYLIKQCASDDSSVLVSALQGQGIDQLSTLLARALHQHKRSYDLQLSFSDGESLAWLYRFGDVLERQEDTLGIHVKVRLSLKDHARYLDRNSV